jgi:hypothetical protein
MIYITDQDNQPVTGYHAEAITEAVIRGDTTTTIGASQYAILSVFRDCDTVIKVRRDDDKTSTATPQSR